MPRMPHSLARILYVNLTLAKQWSCLLREPVKNSTNRYLTSDVNVPVGPLCRFFCPTFPRLSRPSGSICVMTSYTKPRGTAKWCCSRNFLCMDRLVHWFLLWLPFLRLSGLFRSLHISPQSEPSFDSALEDSTHIADSLDPESLELLYESSFGARISVCLLSGSRRFPSQDSEFYSFWTPDVLFGFLGRFLFDIAGQTSSAEVRWLKSSRATRTMGHCTTLAYEQWIAPFVFSSLVLTICKLWLSYTLYCGYQVPSRQPWCIRSF